MEKRFVVEISYPFHKHGRQLTWHPKKFDATSATDRDTLSPDMVQVWEVEAVTRKDALAKIILGKGKMILGYK